MAHPVADPSLAEQVANSWRRLVRTVEESMRLIAEPMRLGARRPAERSPSSVDEPPPPPVPANIMWSNADGTTVCRVIMRTPFVHDVEVAIQGNVVDRFVFQDPVEAAEEACRLRQLFLEPDGRRAGHP